MDDSHQWRIAAVDAPLGPHPIGDSMCAIVMNDGAPTFCTDATIDPRFSHTSWVAGDTPVRFYASAPLRTRAEGVVVGTLCTFDTEPVTLTPAAQARLTDIAALVSEHLELRRLAEELHEAASTDRLTGAASRLILDDRLRLALARVSRRGGSVVVAVADVDNLKTINDEVGHRAGDAVLRATGAALITAVRGEDTVGRTGGDEFVVVCELRAGDNAEKMRQRLTAACVTHVDVGDGYAVTTSASVGAVVAEPLEPPESVIARADAYINPHKRMRHVRDQTTTVLLP
jgi:diguanylate cyclase (GGDEF)-like protein